MALDEREEVREHLEDVEEGEGSDMDERRTQVSSFPSKFVSHLRREY